MIIGLNSLASVMWMVITFFVYIPNDATKKALYAQPISWMWKNLGNNATQGYMAAAYFSNLLAITLVGFLELVGWLLFIGGLPQMAIFWSSTVGFYGVFFLYFLPVCFAM